MKNSNFILFLTAPSPPRNFQAHLINDSTVNLTWQLSKAMNGPVDKFRLEYGIPDLENYLQTHQNVGPNYVYKPSFNYNYQTGFNDIPEYTHYSSAKHAFGIQTTMIERYISKEKRSLVVYGLS